MITETQTSCIEGDVDETENVDRKTTNGFDFLSSADLADGGYDTKYLIQDVLPSGEPGCIAGKSKSLKTTIAIDLALSVATGRKFLNRFEVAETGRVAIMSGESGLATLKETANRISLSKGLKLRDAAEGLLWSTEIPRLPRQKDLVRRAVESQNLKLLIIDPTYFALRDVGRDLANATLVGTALEPLSEICRDCGCSIVMVAHNRKGRGQDQWRYDPPTLEEVAGAGLDQWVRYWLLLGPRGEWDAETGRHRLWMNVGGSSGHSGLWSLDIHEGKQRDPGGRIWSVRVETASESLRTTAAEKERRKQDKAAQQLEEHVQSLLDALKLYPDGETSRKLRDASRLNLNNIGAALEVVLARKEVEECQVIKNGRKQVGYRLTAALPKAA